MSYIDVARADSVPEGRAGQWRVERFTVSRDDALFASLHAMRSGRGSIREGTYTRLVHDRRGIVMSDSPDELRDLLPLRAALLQGEPRTVLIHGLGLGCALRLALATPSVTRVDLVEIDPDVVELLQPERDQRVVLTVADARTFRWPAGTRWDIAWHDIWDELTEENDYARFNRSFARRTGWQGAWGQPWVRLQQQRERRGYGW